mmetsp:Transcript_15494/g.17342  ORF Transcript_15494/g.17342 Transcript_15494/m.17342 type:complete len:444 (+) Transcript_15494:165-1496(+)
MFFTCGKQARSLFVGRPSRQVKIPLAQFHEYHRFSTEPPSSNDDNSDVTSYKTSKVSTVIEPPIRGRPFRNFRAPGAGNYNSSNNLRRLAPKTKRIFVNAHNNDQQQNLPHHRNQQDNIASPSSLLSTIKPVDQYGSYPVIAINVSRSIDLSKVTANVFTTKGVRKMRERLSVVLQLQSNSDTTETARFVAVFGYGSVVFFNVSPKETAQLIQDIKRYSIGTVLSGKERKERYCVHVHPPRISAKKNDSSGFGVDIAIDEENDNTVNDIVTGDYCIVPELNMKCVDVISNIMAQSVALDAYNDTVDQLLADFERINTKVTVEGNLTTVDRDKMFRAVAQNNTIFLRLTKVGIKDRVDTAWNLSQYENVDEGMREEFDIDRRFDHIEFKLNLIQQNAKFFLEVLANQKSNSLEWIIIVLILLECVLMCIEMSGLGGPFFKLFLN